MAKRHGVDGGMLGDLLILGVFLCCVGPLLL